MTYCVAICLSEGLVFLADTRTNAGVDHIGTFRKMTVFSNHNDRVFTLLSAGNLAITQSVRELLHQGHKFHGINLWNAKSSHEAAMVVGEAVRKIHDRDHEFLESAGIEFNCNLIFGGQVGSERPRLFNIYSAGNFIEATPETCFFQIGEAKYGKPILDRVVEYKSSLDLATKCALISMDSTLNSNISVGLPLDLFVYKKDSFSTKNKVTIDDTNPYFNLIHQLWGEKLKKAFMEIKEPEWSLENNELSIVSTPKKLGQIPTFTPQ